MTGEPAGASAVAKRLAHEAGFDIVGIAPAEPFQPEDQALRERIRKGLFSGLPWFSEERAAIASNPRALLPEARSIISAGLSYQNSDGPAGVISRYAWGADYHDVLRAKLKGLQRGLEQHFGAFEGRTFVDTGRLVDRAAAVRAGLGWYGKNTNILNTPLGSWFFIGSLVTTLELEPDRPSRQHCGSCQACLDVCPTGAIVAPYVIDSNRCISYLTIEHRGPIPRELRPLMGQWIFGCDLCQDVCPVNSHARPRVHPEFAWPEPSPAGRTAFLSGLLQMTDEQFRTRFRNSPVKRAKRRGLLRNVAVALGNGEDCAAIPHLATSLAGDPEPLVRGHAAWALGRLGAWQALAEARSTEADPYVLEEIELAITTQ